MEILPRIYYNQALELARSESFPAARDKLLAALALEPGLNEARILLGKVYARLGEYGEATTCWEEVLKSEPGNQVALSGISKAGELRKEIEKARGRRVYHGALLGAAIFLSGILSVAVYQVAYSRLFPPGKTFLEPVRAALKNTAVLQETHLEVTGDKNGIRIVGSVETEDHKRLASAIAESRSGGAPVDVTAVDVKHPAPLAESFTAILKRIGGGGLRSVSVAQRENVLVVSGSVPSISDKRRVEDLGRALVGVRSVDVRGLKIRGATEYTVRNGDNLWDLANRFYGSGALWTAIAESNPQLSPPYKNLQTGTLLSIPPLGNRIRSLPVKEEGAEAR
jgi:nucleoid-associated protein YgaU